MDRRMTMPALRPCPFCGKKSTEGLDAEKLNYWFLNFAPTAAHGWKVTDDERIQGMG